MLTEGAGPTVHARRNVDDQLGAFMCLMDRVMLQHICHCTCIPQFVQIQVYLREKKKKVRHDRRARSEAEQQTGSTSK
ncbi:hypothetical protein KUCAC02_031849 [Chaenocephalus aceratus]|nr:hypothetical protein KUCAC02_031849 [Chaenocephalus aceratus]